MPGEEEQSSGWLPPRPPDREAASSLPPSPEMVSPSRAPGRYRPVKRPPSSPFAVAGIVCGVTGLVFLVLTGGLGFTFAALFGAIAVSCWRVAKRRMAAGQPGRPGQLRAALLLGTALLVLSVVSMIAWAVLTKAGVITPEEFRDMLERERQRLSR